MKYDVYKLNIGKDDELIASGLTLEEAESKIKANPNYAMAPQVINGA
jgi:hypothetical protein